MVGFSTDALILFPKYEYYDNADYRYKGNLKLATEKMVKFLQSKGMQPKAMITDDMARYFGDIPFSWVSTLSVGDLYFMSQNCFLCNHIMSLEADTFPDVYEKIEAKLPYGSGISIEERFKIMCERDKRAAKAIIPQYKVVVHFYQHGAVQYSAATKPGDGKIRIIVDTRNYTCTPYFGGQVEDNIDLLGANYANRSILNWEV